MKKIVTVFAIIGMLFLQGCTTTEDNYVDNDTISAVFETNLVTFSPANDYIVRYTFPGALFTSDMVLVYRLAGTANNIDLWEFLPETYYFDDGTRDFSYNFNFTANYVDIYLSGNELISVPSGNRVDQIFRIVVVPGSFASSLKSTNYISVMSALNIKDNQIQKINF